MKFFTKSTTVVNSKSLNKLASAVGLIMLLLCSVASFGQTVTYTVATKTSVNTTGTAPTGSSAAYTQTFTTPGQIGNFGSATLTLSNYAGYRITAITMRMKSDATGGSGSFTALGGNTTFSSIASSAFNSSNWNGNFSTSFVTITPSVTSYTVTTGQSVVLTIAATADKLYLQSYTITYAPTANYYSKPTGNLDVLSNWGTNTDGTGTAPTNFTNANQTFNIRNNATPTIGGAWTVSGSGSKLSVGDGSTACNFTIPSDFAYSGPMDVSANATVTNQNTANPTFDDLNTTSTVDYNGTGEQTIATANYGNVTISGTRTGTPAIILASGTIGVSGIFAVTLTGAVTYTTTGNTVNFSSASSQAIPAFNYNNITNTGNGARVLASTGTITIGGTTFTPGSGTYTVTGSIVTLTNTTGFILKLPTVASGNSFNTLTINGTGGNYSLEASGSPLNLATTLNVTAGTLILNPNPNTATNTVRVGTINLNGGTLDDKSFKTGFSTILEVSTSWNHTSGIAKTTESGVVLIKFTGGGGTTFTGLTSPDFAAFCVQVSNNTTLTLNSDLAIKGIQNNSFNILTVDAGSTLNAGTFLVTTNFTTNRYSIAGKFRTASLTGFSGTATSTLGSTNNPTITLVSGSTIEYNSPSGTQPVTARTDYSNLTCSGSGTKTLNGNVSLSGALTVNTGVTLNNGGFTIGSPTSVVLENGTTGSTISGAGLLTLGGNVTVNNISGTGTGALISCPVTLANATRTFALADETTTATDLTISGIVSTTGGLTKAGAGTMVLSGDNTYTGTTTLSAGVLELGAADRIANASAFIFTGGTFSTGATAGFSETIGVATLSANSTIKLGTGVHTLTIANSSAATWGAFTLTINGWTGTAGSTGSGTAGKIQVGVGGLSAAQLDKIQFTGYELGAVIKSDGELVPKLKVTYYSQATGAPNTLGNWNSIRTGGGSSPANFTNGDVFVIQNGHVLTTSSAWSVSGTSSKVQIENGGTLIATFAITLDVATTFQIDNGGTYQHGVNSTAVFAGTNTFGATSTVIYNLAGAQSIFDVVAPGYGNLTLAGTNTKTAPASTLDIQGNVLISSTFAAGTSQTHNVQGDWTNNGTFSFTTASTINFNGNNALQTISGSATTTFGTITVAKTAQSNILEVTSAIGLNAGGLTLTSGTFKLSGTFSLTNTFFSTASYTIPEAAGFWLNNANVTVTAQNGSPTLIGLLRVTAGTYNIGTNSGNTMSYNSGAILTLEGGTINVAGRFSPNTASTSTVTYNQSGGVITVCTVGSTSGTLAPFDLGATGSSFTMSSGSIVIQNTSSNAVDYLNLAATNNVSGGTIQFGNTLTTGSPLFVINSSAPVFNLTVNSIGTPKLQLATNALTVKGRVTIGSGTTLDAGTNTINMDVAGDWTNNGGTFTPGTSTANFNGTGAQAINGSATTQTFNNITLTKTAGQTLSVSGSTTTLNVGGNFIETTGNFSAPATMSITGNTTLTAGTFTAGTNLTVNGNWTNNGGTFTNTGSTINLNGTAQTIGGTTASNFNNLVLANSGIKTLSLITAIAGDLSISGTATATFNATGNTANTLTLGGYNQNFGTWGGTSTTADNINTAYFNSPVTPANKYITVATGSCTTGLWLGSTSTDWNTAANWCGGIPTASTNVVIPSGTAFQPTIGAASVCNNITINSGATLTISGSNTLTLNNLTNGGTITANASTLFIGGVFTNTGTFTAGTGTVNYSGAAQTVTVVTYNNLTLSGSGTKTLQTGTTNVAGNLTLSGTAAATTVVNFTIGGNLLVGDGTNAATFTAAGFTLGVTGTTTVANASSLAISSATGTKTFTGAATINTGGTLSESAAATLAFGNNLTINGTLTEFGAATVGITGSLTNNGTYTASTGVHTFSGTTKTIGGTTTNTIPSATFTGAYTNSGTLTCATALAVTGVTLTNTRTINSSTALTGTGTLSNTSGTVNITGGSCSITTNTNAGTFAISNAATSTTALANFTNTGTINISGSGTITGITNNAGGVVNHSGSSNITSFNNATATSTLNISTTPTVPTFGLLTVSTAGNTVNYSGAGDQTVKAQNYGGNLTLSGSGTKTILSGTGTITGNLTLSGTATSAPTTNLSVGGNLLVGDGTNAATFTEGNSLITINGITTVANAATLAMSNGAYTKTFTGAVTINAGGTISESVACTLAFGNDLTINGTLTEFGTGTLSIAGSLTNNGTYTAGTGVHTFSGTAKTIGGSTTTSIASVAVTGTYTNNGTLTVGTALSGSGGLTQGASSVLNIGGTSSITTLTATAAANTVNYNAAGAQTVKLTTYANLTLSGSGTKTLGATTISSNLSISGTAVASLTGNSTAGTLTLGSSGKTNGTWGSTSSAATNQTNTYFSSTGIVTVSTDYREFITKWNLATAGSGTNQLSINTATSGTVTYYWQEVGGTLATGSGSFSGSTLTISGLPTGATIRLGIYPTNFKSINIYNGADKSRLLDVEQWGTTIWTSMQTAFYGCNNLNITATDIPVLTSCTTMQGMFQDCTTLNGPSNINSWNTGAVTNMSNMFFNATAFNQPIGSWTTTAVTSMSNMFFNAAGFNQPIGSWNTSLVTSMQYMFYGATTFNQTIGAWLTTAVTTMAGMFNGATAFNQNIGNWNTGAVTNMNAMFGLATAFNQNIASWNTALVNDMTYMFYKATVFNQPIGTWNTGAVTNMSNMFREAAAFNQPIGSWNTSAVTNMDAMFSTTAAFNQSIGTWNIGAVTSMTAMFKLNTAFNKDISAWNTSAVTSMSQMFYGATAFNQPIGSWNTSSVQQMNFMFYGTTAFNQSIGSWNTSAVTTMSYMFQSATAFNQNIGSWNLNANVILDGMFNYSGIDCSSYATTLIGWNANASCPTNRTLGASGITYFSQATAARTNLALATGSGGKGWTITGDAVSSTNCGAFITKWNLATTGSGATQLSFGTATSGTVNYYWQEVSPGTATGSGTFTGTTLNISGLPTGATIRLGIYPTNFQGISISNGTDKSRLLDLEQWGSTVWTSMAFAFYGCNNLNITATDLPVLTSCTSMEAMFQNCSTLNGPSNINSWNTSAVTTMKLMFANASAFNQNISSWNTATVKDMNQMFLGASAFNQNIGSWNTAAVTNMQSMFYFATAFNQNIGSWNTANVTEMRQLFWGASAFNQNIGGWNTAAVTSMFSIFRDASTFNNGGSSTINNWNTAAVTNMQQMFNGATAFNQNIGSWSLNANVTMLNMLNNSGMDCLNYGSTLSGWNANVSCPTGRTLGATGMTYGPTATAARANLVGAKGWTITGDGLPAGIASTTPTVCINTSLTNITHATVGVTGIGVATGLPAGVNASWAYNVITIYGAPTVAGIFNYSIPVNGSCSAVYATGTITVTTINTVSAASSTPTLCISTLLTNITHSTTGATGIGTATNLPAGVTAAWASNTITISGTPTASGTFSYSIPLTGGCSAVNATGTITVTPNNTASVASSTPTLCISTALTNITHTTTRATGIGSATNLPTGVTAAWASNTITISGTPTASGTFNYSIPLTGGCGTVNATGTITVSPASVGGTIAGSATVCTGTNSTVLTLSGHTGNITRWESSLDNFATAGTSIANITTTLTATNLSATTYYREVLTSSPCSSTNSATATITVTPSNTIALTSAAGSNNQSMCSPAEFVMITYATTGATGATFSGLPAGLSGNWSSNVATISGTPTASGTFNYTVTLTGGCGTVTGTGTIATYFTTWTVTSGTGSWNNGNPAASVGAVIAGNYTLATDLTACTLTVTNNANVAVPTGITYTIMGKVDVQSGSLTFENGASLLQTTYTAANSGNVIYKRNTTVMYNNYDFTYWGSPVGSQALSGIWMGATAPYTFYSFSSASSAWMLQSSTQVMSPGLGYIARSRNGNYGTDFNNVTTQYAGGTPWLAKFYGVPNNGNYTVPVNGANGYTDNLLSNPYPSAIDLIALRNDPINVSQLSGNFYFWTHNTAITNNAYTVSDYAIFNVALNAGVNTASGATPAPDRYVDAGQGFFAEGAANGTVTFKNSHRTAGNNNAFYRVNNTSTTAGTVESHKIWLDMTNLDGLYKQQLLTYTQGATMGFEQSLDARTFDGNDYIDFYSIAADDNLTIQSRSFPFNSTDIVPLGYKTAVAGAYKIKIDHVDGLFLGNQNIYLRDNLLNVIHDIKASEYAFTSSVGTFNSRFEIVYNNPNLVISTPTFTQVSAICPGATLAALPTTSNNGITGTWSPALNNTTTTTYTFTPTTGQNAIAASMTIAVNNAIAGTVSANQIIINGTQPAAISLSDSFGAIQWQKSTDNIHFTDIVGATNSILTSTQIGALTANRFFRAVVKSGSCASVVSGIVSVTIVTSTSVIDAQCGATLAALNTDIMANFVQGVTDYRFKVVANGTTEVIDRGNRRYFNLAVLTSGAAYNTAYTISVATKYNGVWGDYGTACTVTTPALPTTKIKAAQCGATLADLNTDIQADWLQFATAYRFKVVANGNTEVIEKPYRYFNLTSLTAATYNTAYTISVAVQHNGVWGDYGNECVVSTPMAPTTKVQAAQCGATLPALNTDIQADWLQFATAYRFKVVVNGASYIVTPIANRRYFSLTSLLVTITAATTYTISVAVQNNGVWGDYGAECSVTTPGGAANSKQLTELPSIETIDFSLVAYPNPSNSAFKLQVKGANNDAVSILVFDITGRQIENKVITANDIENISFGQNYSTGIYNVMVSQGMNSRTVRLVKN